MWYLLETGRPMRIYPQRFNIDASYAEEVEYEDLSNEIDNETCYN